MTCPKCGTENTDDWPLEISGEIVDGGCQNCWESECDRKWWDLVIAIDNGGCNVN